MNCGNKDARYRCLGCKSVYFCDEECQRKCWKTHKRHCKRDLFIVCINCGKSNNSTTNLIKCPDCPVKFCSQICKDTIFQAHKEFDCEYFKLTF